MRPAVRPRMTRPGSGSPTVSSRSSRPLAQTAPACLAGRAWPGRCPAARPGRCRNTAAVPPDRPPTRPVKVAYMPAGPGNGPRTSAGQARAGSLQCCGRLQRTWATSPGDSSSQVWPKASPAACPVAHTSAPAPAAAPRPTARSWSPGLVNGGASGGRCPPGGRGGQASCHIRVTPRHDPDTALARCLLVDQQRAVLLGVCGNQTASRRLPGSSKPGIAASAESLAPSSRLSLADTVGLAHAGQRGRILAAAVIGRLRPLPLMGLAVGGELAIGSPVEGARRPALTAVGTVLACVSNESRRVVTIRLHLGVHSVGVAGPRGGCNPPRWPLHRTAEGGMGESGC